MNLIIRIEKTIDKHALGNSKCNHFILPSVEIVLYLYYKHTGRIIIVIRNRKI